MQLRSFKIPFYFFVTGMLWAICNDPLITILGHGLQPGTQDILRELSDVLSVVVVTVLLYFLIKKQNSRLVESEEQYRHLFESNPNPMWIYRPADLRFVKVNNAATDVYGYDMDEFLSMKITDIRPEEDKNKLKKYVGSLEPGMNKSGTWKHLKKDGELLYVSIVTYDLKFNGQACRLVMATNITDLILKEEKIRIQNAALHEMAWSNSHEIRRSLCSVMSLTALLRDSANESERKEYINLLYQCTQDFDNIIKKNNKKVDSLKEN
ncbi:MAG: PAS domain S-box protein [Bacteroidetes bacterium]|nr:PAS domain S-box protein [Bacteroidota bacterium]